MSNLRTRYRRLATVGPSSLPDGLLFLLLCSCAALYRFVVSCRLACYRSGIFRIYRAGVPVVSVGNLTVGGTGKTPVVDVLLRWAITNGVRVAVVSRGYGGHPGKEALLVADGRQLLVSHAAVCGDEPLLLARRNPEALIIVAPHRQSGVRLAERHSAQLVILDDGFQHLAVARDLDIVLLDSRQPFGNRCLLPAGILREPVKNLIRADLVILTRYTPGDVALAEFPETVLHARHELATRVISLDGEMMPWAELSGRPCAAFAGIANPPGFFELLRQRGMHLVAEVALDDHQIFSSAVLSELAAAGRDAEFFLTTEKDAVKLNTAQLPLPCYRVPLDICIEPFASIEEKLHNLLSRSSLS